MRRVVVIPVDEASGGLAQQECGELLSLGTRRGVDRTVGEATAELELRISPSLVVAVQEVGPGFVTKLEVVIAPVDIRCDLTKAIGRKIEVVSDFVVNPTVVVDHDVGEEQTDPDPTPPGVRGRMAES